MASSEFKQFYQTLKAQAPPPDMSILEMREYFEKMMSAFPASADIKIIPATFKHCEGVWFHPPKVSSKKILLFFHGGAYTAGSWQSHQDMIGRIAKEGEIPVCAINYRLAPEHPFPAALNDAVHAYHSLLEQGYQPSQIIVGGSSAGGGLTLALFLKLKMLKIELPAAGILICPWVDLAHLIGQESSKGQDIISKSRIIAASKAYLGSHDPKDPLASPLYGNLSGLPSLLVQVGTLEILWSEIQQLVQKAQKAGVQVTEQVYEGMFHTWQLFAAKIPEGQQALAAIGRFIKAQNV